jgi:hypothetical protein
MYLATLVLTGQGGPDGDLPWYTKGVVLMTGIFSVAMFAIPASMLTWGFEAEAQRLAAKTKRTRTKRVQKMQQRQRQRAMMLEGVNRDCDDILSISSSSSASSSWFSATSSDDGDGSSSSSSSVSSNEEYLNIISGGDADEAITNMTGSQIDPAVVSAITNMDESASLTKRELLELLTANRNLPRPIPSMEISSDSLNDYDRRVREDKLQLRMDRMEVVMERLASQLDKVVSHMTNAQTKNSE